MIPSLARKVISYFLPQKMLWGLTKTFSYYHPGRNYYQTIPWAIYFVRPPAFLIITFASCFSPWKAREATGVEIAEKWGKLTKFPSPGPTPENGEKCPKKGVKLLRKYSFCNFSVIFPHFRGSDRGGEFWRFPPRWLAGPSKGKNNL